jgi:hypothetical protein
MSTYRHYQRRVIAQKEKPDTQQDESVDDHEESPIGAGAAILARLVYAVSAIVLSLLAIRFLLSLFGANRASGFGDFIYTASQPLVAPFLGLFSYKAEYGVSRFEVETLIAAAIYAIITALIITILTIPNSRDNL